VKIEHVICSGPGCLRLLTYLKGHNRIVAVDSIETRGATVDARPYAIANPQFKKFPLFGELRGHDNLELIAGLNPSPDIIFKTFIGANMDSANLTAKTGITVSNLNYGNLTYGMADLRKSLRTMGGIMGLNQRAEEVIDYFENIENDLRERTKGLASEEIFNCYLGGVAMKGPHGLQSTEPAFAPFIFTNTRNVAASLAKKQAVSYANVSKEQLVFWNPQVIFLDASTLQMGPESNALYELKNDAAYKDLSAVKEGRIYVLFPYYSYQQNFESAFANAYYVGKVLYPERFKDVDPLEKGEAIATFLNGAPAFRKMKEQYKGLPFSKI
jgi:iron complex transport system substrate-binding protein